ncbi:hypothetical protein [Spiroplasma endosymbiont of Apeira syringaria]|uniref:hypothetical protein n=1 Tax=Spiroplasma endosymbiont of Apeira syringaria TaxID=3066307 RepID=UPI0030CBBD17
MFIPFITTVMQLFASIFMKFFSFPLGDLGFNLGTLMIFLILLRFAFRVILPELMLPTLGLGYAVKFIGKSSVSLGVGTGQQIAKSYQRRVEKVKTRNKQQGKFKGGSGGNNFTGSSTRDFGIGD